MVIGINIKGETAATVSDSLNNALIVKPNPFAQSPMSTLINTV